MLCVLSTLRLKKPSQGNVIVRSSFKRLRLSKALAAESMTLLVQKGDTQRKLRRVCLEIVWQGDPHETRR